MQKEKFSYRNRHHNRNKRTSKVVSEHNQKVSMQNNNFEQIFTIKMHDYISSENDLKKLLKTEGDLPKSTKGAKVGN